MRHAERITGVVGREAGQSTLLAPISDECQRQADQQEVCKPCEEGGGNRDDEGFNDGHEGGSFRALNIGDEGRLHNG
jgi:hypothetical protein